MDSKHPIGAVPADPLIDLADRLAIEARKLRGRAYVARSAKPSPATKAKDRLRNLALKYAEARGLPPVTIYKRSAMGSTESQAAQGLRAILRSQAIADAVDVTLSDN